MEASLKSFDTDYCMHYQCWTVVHDRSDIGSILVISYMLVILPATLGLVRIPRP